MIIVSMTQIYILVFSWNTWAQLHAHSTIQVLGPLNYIVTVRALVNTYPSGMCHYTKCTGVQQHIMVTIIDNNNRRY